MKTLKLAVLTLALALMSSVASAQTGTALTSTTLVSNLGASATSFALSSVSGITATGAGINNPNGGTSQGIGNITSLYIDRELMQVVGVNSTAKTVTVLRGVGGTQSAQHSATYSIVIIVPASQIFDYDPSGYCATITGQQAPFNTPPQYSPWINQRTGQQFICSTVTSTWVPGFGNPGNLVPLGLTTATTGATITPTGPYFQQSGTTALVTINLPAMAQNGTQITIEFTGSASGLTWTAAGNISAAGTATTTLSNVVFTYNAATSKWIPSRLS